MGPGTDAGRPGRDRATRGVLVSALILFLLAVSALVHVLHRSPARPSAAGDGQPGALQPPGGGATFVPAASGLFTPSAAAGGSGGASPTTGPAGAAPPSGPGTVSSQASTAPPAPVICQSDLPLAQSPSTPYNFLCTQDGRPLTWKPGQTIDLYASGLTALQNAVLPEALSQWEAEGGFTVVQVSTPASANVVVGAAPLDDSEAGDATVRYDCTTAACFYSHGSVELSSTAALTKTLWSSTVLHELGHVAGLNHVALSDEVLYPIISDTSPDAYTPGDLQGLQALAQARQNSSTSAGTVLVSGAVAEMVATTRPDRHRYPGPLGVLVAAACSPSGKTREKRRKQPARTVPV